MSSVGMSEDNAASNGAVNWPLNILLKWTLQ